MAITRIITPAVNDDAVTLAKMASGTDGAILLVMTQVEIQLLLLLEVLVKF